MYAEMRVIGLPEISSEKQIHFHVPIFQKVKKIDRLDRIYDSLSWFIELRQ